MTRKRPSSLDYEGHLHELAQNNWRRALVQRDRPRAEVNARKLAASHDKFWRFTGWMHLATVHLTRGWASPALDALASAARAYPESRALVGVTRIQTAHVSLSTGFPRRALEMLDIEGAVGDSSEGRYWRALAHARLAFDSSAHGDQARRLADALEDGPLHDHVSYELRGEHGDLELFRRSVRSAAGRTLASPAPFVPLDLALATALANQGELDEASATLSHIVKTPEAVLHWPLPYVRSVFQLGRIEAMRGNRKGAIENYRDFLGWWQDAEIDREALVEASQFVNE